MLTTCHKNRRQNKNKTRENTIKHTLSGSLLYLLCAIISKCFQKKIPASTLSSNKYSVLSLELKK